MTLLTKAGDPERIIKGEPPPMQLGSPPKPVVRPEVEVLNKTVLGEMRMKPTLRNKLAVTDMVFFIC